MSPAAEIGAALAALCPPGVGCAAVALDDDLPPLWAGEEEAVARALPRRRREFAAGRAAARAALGRAGHVPVALPALPDRCPGWPQGLRGSIAHSGSVAVAVAGRAASWAGLGLDLEPVGQVTEDLAPAILRVEERGLDPTAVFCAKEAVQKAVFPVCRDLLEFHDLTLDGRGLRFEARLLRRSGPLPAGLRLRGLWAHAGGHVLAGVFWPATASRNMSASFAVSTPTS